MDERIFQVDQFLRALAEQGHDGSGVVEDGFLHPVLFPCGQIAQCADGGRTQVGIQCLHAAQEFHQAKAFEFGIFDGIAFLYIFFHRLVDGVAAALLFRWKAVQFTARAGQQGGEVKLRHIVHQALQQEGARELPDAGIVMGFQHGENRIVLHPFRCSTGKHFHAAVFGFLFLHHIRTAQALHLSAVVLFGIAEALDIVVEFGIAGGVVFRQLLHGPDLPVEPIAHAGKDAFLLVAKEIKRLVAEGAAGIAHDKNEVAFAGTVRIHLQVACRFEGFVVFAVFGRFAIGADVSAYDAEVGVMTGPYPVIRFVAKLADAYRRNVNQARVLQNHITEQRVAAAGEHFGNFHRQIRIGFFVCFRDAADVLADDARPCGRIGIASHAFQHFLAHVLVAHGDAAGNAHRDFLFLAPGGESFFDILDVYAADCTFHAMVVGNHESFP